MRISISEESYWLLASCAVKEHMRPNALLEKWIKEHDSHRDGKAKNPDKPPCLPDSTRPKGTFSLAEIDQIKLLHREGQSPGKIAKIMGRHKSSIAYAIDAMKKRGEL